MKAEVAKEVSYQKYHNLVAIELAKFEGKKLTKRLVTNLEKALPGATIYWEHNAGMININISGVPEFMSYNDRLRLFLGYDKDLPSYSVERFEYADYCHGGESRDRVIKTCELLDSTLPEKIDQAIQNLGGAFEDLRALAGNSFSNPAYYRILDIVKEVTGIKDISL